MEDASTGTGFAVTHVWLYNFNGYARDATGRLSERGRWIKHEVIGETSRSWVLQHGRKVAKRGGNGFILDDAELERHIYVMDQRHRIADAVRMTRDYDALTRIAEIIGYTAD